MATKMLPVAVVALLAVQLVHAQALDIAGIVDVDISGVVDVDIPGLPVPTASCPCTCQATEPSTPSSSQDPGGADYEYNDDPATTTNPSVPQNPIFSEDSICKGAQGLSPSDFGDLDVTEKIGEVLEATCNAGASIIKALRDIAGKTAYIRSEVAVLTSAVTGLQAASNGSTNATELAADALASSFNILESVDYQLYYVPGLARGLRVLASATINLPFAVAEQCLEIIIALVVNLDLGDLGQSLVHLLKALHDDVVHGLRLTISEVINNVTVVQQLNAASDAYAHALGNVKVTLTAIRERLENGSSSEVDYAQLGQVVRAVTNTVQGVVTGFTDFLQGAVSTLLSQVDAIRASARNNLAVLTNQTVFLRDVDSFANITNNIFTSVLDTVEVALNGTVTGLLQLDSDVKALDVAVAGLLDSDAVRAGGTVDDLLQGQLNAVDEALNGTVNVLLGSDAVVASTEATVKNTVNSTLQPGFQLLLDWAKALASMI